MWIDIPTLIMRNAKALSLSMFFRQRLLRLEPRHEKICFMPYANNKDADQPAHPCSLISIFVVRFFDSTCIISIDALLNMSRLYLVSEAEPAGFSLTWLQPLKTGCLTA